MTAVPLTCPYCNAPVPAPPTLTAGQRVPCPRCGESFTVLAAQAAGPPATAVTANPPAPGPVPVVSEPRRPGNRAVAAAVLGVMVFMAAIGLAFALYTQGERRANDLGLKQRPRRHLLPFDRPETEPVTPSRPADLAALGYVPPGSNVVLGLQVAELLQDEAGRRLLSDPITVGRQEVRPGQLADWCGLAPGDVDHLVVALATDDPILPRVNVIVRTRRPYQADRVRAALKAEKAPAAAGKELYRFSLPNSSFQPVVWFLDDRTLAVGLIPAHLETVPARPAAGLGQLPAELRELLKERLEPAPAWCAGVVDDRARALAATLLSRVPKEELEPWTALRGFSAWVQVGQDVRAGATLHARDEKAAGQLAQKLTGPGWKAFADGSWVTLQWKGELEPFFKGLARQ